MLPAQLDPGSGWCSDQIILQNLWQKPIDLKSCAGRFRHCGCVLPRKHPFPPKKRRVHGCRGTIFFRWPLSCCTLQMPSWTSVRWAFPFLWCLSTTNSTGNCFRPVCRCLHVQWCGHVQTPDPWMYLFPAMHPFFFLEKSSLVNAVTIWSLRTTESIDSGLIGCTCICNATIATDISIDSRLADCKYIYTSEKMTQSKCNFFAFICISSSCVHLDDLSHRHEFTQPRIHTSLGSVRYKAWVDPEHKPTCQALQNLLEVLISQHLLLPFPIYIAKRQPERTRKMDSRRQTTLAHADLSSHTSFPPPCRYLKTVFPSPYV